MSGNSFLLDTNIVLYLLRGDDTLAELLNEKQLYISIITEMELLGFIGIGNKEETAIRDFIGQCKTVNINENIKEGTITLRKRYGTKLPDSIIAATALYLDMPLVTADTGFTRVTELDLVNYEKEA
jgi:predicted nucleic acid-binding protein